jgi:hypothetical protein
MAVRHVAIPACLSVCVLYSVVSMTGPAVSVGGRAETVAIQPHQSYPQHAGLVQARDLQKAQSGAACGGWRARCVTMSQHGNTTTKWSLSSHVCSGTVHFGSIVYQR